MFTPDILVLLIGAAVAGGLVVGIAGFGGGPVVLSIWLLFLEPTVAAPALMLAGVFFLLPAMWSVRGGIKPRRIVPFAIGAAIGLPLGTQLLIALTSEQIKFAIGVFLVAFAAVRLLWLQRYQLPLTGRQALLADGGVGTFGGIVCGTTALPGPIFSMWCGMRGWSKDEQRGVYQPLNYAVCVMSVVSFASVGLITEKVMTVSAWAAPSIIVGVLLGTPLYKRMSDAVFGKVILVLLAAMGVVLIASN